MKFFANYFCTYLKYCKIRAFTGINGRDGLWLLVFINTACWVIASRGRGSRCRVVHLFRNVQYVLKTGEMF